MSDTITDMAKITQMLDAGWVVRIYKGELGSYEVEAFHPNADVRRRIAKKLRETHESVSQQTLEYEPEYDWNGKWLGTDDFTPEQALTRMAYKVHGEIL